mgnify:CR=1 FL=1
MMQNRFTDKKYLNNVDIDVKYFSIDALSNAISTYNLKADSEAVPSLKYFIPPVLLSINSF